MKNHPRNQVEAVVKNGLLGPLNGNEEILEKSPRTYYVTGVLYPLSSRDNKNDLAQNDGSDDEKFPLNLSDSAKKHEAALKLSQTSSSLDEQREDNDELNLVTDFTPKALGVSCVVDQKAEINLNIQYGTYLKVKKNENGERKIEEGKKPKRDDFNYKRIHHSLDGIILTLDDKQISLIKNGEKKVSHPSFIRYVDEDHNDLKITIVKRKYTLSSSMTVLTVTCSNNRECEKSITDPESCVFQTEILLKSSDPIFNSFSDERKLEKIRDPEEVSNKLLYADYKKFASGHGVSATWENAEDSELTLRKWVKTQYIPEFEVLDNDFNPDELNGAESDILFIKPLAGDSFSSDGLTKAELIPKLKRFISHYANWVSKQDGLLDARVKKMHYSEESKKRLIQAGNENIEKCKVLANRMLYGVKLLEKNDEALKSFYDANRAMFIQRAMGYFVKTRQKESKDFIFPTEETYCELPDFSGLPADASPGEDYFAKWRPFQLAFLLSQIPGMVNKDSIDRETVDLIWFSTGGGKTEAYLGLIAMYMLHRRLQAKKEFGDPDKGAGVSAIMRYTLRLLIKQQYGRATPLVMACELIRRQENSNYGRVPFSIGIWVGQSLTPNKIDGKSNDDDSSFRFSFNKLKNDPTDKTKYSLPFYSCPACGTSLIKRKIQDVVKGEWGCFGRKKRGRENGPFKLHCTNIKCDFHVPENDRRDEDIVKDNFLPIYFIDEDIYDNKPSLIFSTVDKFASINWNLDCFKLFNISFTSGIMEYTYQPPELIIQDELHLISSSLGTIVGVYEMAFENLLKDKFLPKIVAATATVRDAESQCRLLYGRSEYQQFPPPGINADDSFFSRKKKWSKEQGVKKEPQGRKYIGIQPSGFTNTIAQIRLVSNLMQITQALDINNDEFNPYYTNLIYFNTIKELGKFRTLLMDDISAYKKYLSNSSGSHGTTFFKSYRSDEIAELSSQLDADSITRNLNVLENIDLPDVLDADKASVLNSIGIRRASDVKGGGETWNSEFKLKFNKPEIFEKLEIKDWSSGTNKDIVSQNREKFEECVISVFENQEQLVPQLVAATNMISVGIDIERFNVMQITGQPKTHSEYIQASSRSGRSKKGLVITTFNPAKNRDRSHYESFIDYHQGFYRYVESTSITPYSEPALEKALAAVCFCLAEARHYHGHGGGVEKHRPALWTDGLDEFLDELEVLFMRRIEMTVKGFSGFSSNDLKNWRKNVSTRVKEIKVYWKNHNLNHPDSEMPTYSSFLTPDKVKRIENIDNALYIMPEMKVKYKRNDKESCLTSMRNVETSVPINLSNHLEEND